MKSFITSINKIYDIFDKINGGFIVLLMALMCLNVFLQVIARFIFAHPFTWSEELSRYLFVWISLLGAAWCGRRHLHIRMTIVINKLPPTMIRLLQIIISLFCAATCFYLLPFAWKIFVAQSRLTAITLGVTLGVEYVVAPVGILMMAVQWTVDALYAMFDWDGYKDRYVSKEVE